MTMIERVARAIAELEYSPGGYTGGYDALARAAIAAMREPTNDFEQIRVRAAEQVKQLWPKITPNPPSEESLRMVADIAAAVAYYERQRWLAVALEEK